MNNRQSKVVMSKNLEPDKTDRPSWPWEDIHNTLTISNMSFTNIEYELNNNEYVICILTFSSLAKNDTAIISENLIRK